MREVRTVRMHGALVRRGLVCCLVVLASCDGADVQQSPASDSPQAQGTPLWPPTNGAAESPAAMAVIDRVRQQFQIDDLFSLGSAAGKKTHSLLPTPEVSSIAATATGLNFAFASAARGKNPHGVALTLPSKAGTFHLKSTDTRVELDVTLKSQRNAAAELAKGYVVYPAALGGNGDVIHVPLADGTEDFVAFNAKPAASEIAYEVALGTEVKGLRLIDNVLEFLDDKGVPRMRTAHPWIRDIKGHVVYPSILVEGCSYDSSGQLPWEHPTTPPGRSSCTVRVKWDDSTLTYPALLDPTWSGTGTMTAVRFLHSANLFPTPGGATIIAGGFDANWNAQSSVELFTPSNSTFTAWIPMNSPHAGHTATIIPNGAAGYFDLVVAGGAIGNWTSRMTSQVERFNTSIGWGQWQNIGNLVDAKGWHSSVKLPASSDLLVCGGTIGYTGSAVRPLASCNRIKPNFTVVQAAFMPQARLSFALDIVHHSSGDKATAVGGKTTTAGLPSNQVDIYDEWADAWSTAPGRLPYAVFDHVSNFGGSVLNNAVSQKERIFGGSSTLNPAITNSTAVYEPNTGTWSTGPALQGTGRANSASVMLTDKSVMISGGYYANGTHSTLVDMFGRWGNWSSAPPLHIGRNAHTASLTGDGRILIAGGYTDTGGTANAEYYTGDPIPPKPMNCSASPFGPPDATGNYFIPFSISSKRHIWAGDGDATQQLYGYNADYNWQMWFNGNVTSAGLVFQKGTAGVANSSPGTPGFNTEGNYDKLTLGSVVLSGNLDNNHTVEYSSALSPLNLGTYTDDNYFNMEWVSDYSVDYQGWTTKGAHVACGRTDQPAGPGSNISRLHANGQRDGVLLGTGDVRYFTTVVDANYPMLIHLKPEGRAPAGKSHANYDLYASWGTTTMTPSPAYYDWSSTRALDASGNMLEDVLLILPYGDGQPHYLYIGVYAQNEGVNNVGGFRLYDNTVTKQFTWRASTDFDYRNGAFGNVTSKVLSTLQSSSGALYQATDGTAYVVHWDLWNNDNTCGGNSCAMVLSSGSGPTFCGGSYGCGNIGVSTQVVHRAWLGSTPASVAGIIASHEIGHCLYNFNDEYNYAGPGYQCGHSVMNGPAAVTNALDYCTGTSDGCANYSPLNGKGNHNADCTNFTNNPLQKSTGNWSDIAGCFPSQTAFYSPTGTPKTPDPEAWEDWAGNASDIWSYYGLTSITQVN